MTSGLDFESLAYTPDTNASLDARHLTLLSSDHSPSAAAAAAWTATMYSKNVALPLCTQEQSAQQVGRDLKPEPSPQSDHEPSSWPPPENLLMVYQGLSSVNLESPGGLTAC